MGLLRNCNKYIIYKVTSPSGKVYIGATGKTLKERKSIHKYHSKKNNTPFYRAINKYKESMIWEEICSAQTLQDIVYLEKYFISLYQSNDLKKGYNLTIGGDGCSGLVRTNIRKQYIDNFGNIFLGSQEAARFHKISLDAVQSSAKFGYICRQVDYTLFFSFYKKGQTCAIRRVGARNKRVLEKTHGICFNNSKEASLFFKVPVKAIRRVASGMRECTYNLKFEYLEV